uniref:ORF2b protein n=1 Tax=Lucheng Rn rat coronavirus TaxID=1508224 RepID=A0A866VZY9_9ALPC|nr:ORF2b protein [Lucheng Rn rat coronavirus]
MADAKGIMLYIFLSATLCLSVAIVIIVSLPYHCDTIILKCRDNWVGYNDKCYYFSNDTASWKQADDFCRRFYSILAPLHSLHQISFLKRFKDTFDYWLGVVKYDGKWSNYDGSHLPLTFLIRGVEDYAYLNNNGISSARVYADRRFICYYSYV